MTQASYDILPLQGLQIVSTNVVSRSHSWSILYLFRDNDPYLFHDFLDFLVLHQKLDSRILQPGITDLLPEDEE